MATACPMIIEWPGGGWERAIPRMLSPSPVLVATTGVGGEIRGKLVITVPIEIIAIPPGIIIIIMEVLPEGAIPVTIVEWTHGTIIPVAMGARAVADRPARFLLAPHRHRHMLVEIVRVLLLFLRCRTLPRPNNTRQPTHHRPRHRHRPPSHVVAIMQRTGSTDLGPVTMMNR